MKLADYLQAQVSASTVKIYLFEINHFINYTGESKARTADYNTVMNYVLHLRNKYDNPRTIHRIIQSLKHYFFYLIEIGARSAHPCRYLRIKDQGSKDIQVQDLLSEKELQQLLVRVDRYPSLKIKNQVIMSLLVHQALRVKEMVNLKIEDVDLVDGKLNVKATNGTNERILNLKAEQILLFHEYLKETRKLLLKVHTDSLIITARGTAEKGEGIHYLVSTYQNQYPTKKISPTRIRQSVIAVLLRSGIDLRVVQVFAGHKKASSTEKYRQTNLEALKQSITQYHPLR